MSLDVYLTTQDVDGNEIEVYEANITHNLGKMADEAGISKALWAPKENGYTLARDLIANLEGGLAILKERPEYFKQFNPSNGWGTYEGLVRFVENYLEACKRFPSAKIVVWR